MPRRTVATLVATALTASLLVASASAASAAAPDAPALSPATTDADGDVRLAWDAAPGASAYRVELATDPTFSDSSRLARVDTYNRSWVPTTELSAADEARTLYWRVAAFGSSTSATTLGAFSGAEQFDVPAGDAAQLVSPGSVDGGTVVYPAPVVFRWQPVVGAQKYRLQYSSEELFTSSTTTVETTGTSYAPTAPLARETEGGTPITWYWRVQPVLFSGTSTGVTGPMSSTSHFTVTWPAEAARPTLLSPPSWTEGAAGLSDVRLEWSPVPGASRYAVVIGTARSTDGLLVESKLDAASGSTTATTWVPTIAFLDQNLYWQVIPYDRSGNAGTPSEVRQFRKVWGSQTGAETAADPGVTYPRPLVGGSELAPQTMSIDDVVLSWEPVARATMYEVEVVPHDATPRLTCRTASTTATIVAVNNAGSGSPTALKGAGKCLWTTKPSERIKPGQVYTWRVRAVDYSGSATTLLTAGVPTGSLTSEWSDPEVNGAESRERWIEITDPHATLASVAEPDTAAWAAHLDATSDGQPAPTFSWNPAVYLKNKGTDQAPDWVPVPVDGYEVIVALNSSMTNQVVVARTPSTSLRLTGVLNDNETGLPYYWSVRPFVASDDAWTELAYTASRSAGTPSWTKTSVATELAGAPTPGADGTTVLSWKPQALTAPGDGGSRGYLVTVQQSNGTVIGSQKVEYPWYVAANPATGKPLADGTYKFTVAPLDANGNPGRASAAQSFTVAAPQPVASPAVAGASSATLAWTTPAAAVRFEAQYWSTATGTPVTVGGTSNTQSAVTAADLAPGTYGWHARSVDTAGNVSRWSADATFTVANRSPVLTTPASTVLSTSSRVLDWKPVAGASRYVVQVATTAGGLTSAKQYETVATSFAPVETMAFGTTYYWRVLSLPEKYATSSARTVLGESVAAPVSVLTTPGAVTAQTPTVAGTGLAFTWTALSGAAAGTSDAVGYVVRYRVKQTPEVAWTELAPTNGTSMTLAGLAKNTTYELQVAGENSEGRGPWSVTREKLTATVPGTPGTLTLTSRLNGVDLAWTRPSTGGSDLKQMVVRYRPTTSTTWKQVVLAPTLTRYSLTGLASSTRYRVEVYATNGVGSGPVAAAEQLAYGRASAPGSVKAVRGDRSAKVTWAAPTSTGGASLTGFVVQSRTYSSSSRTWSSWSTRTTTTAAARTVTLTGLTNGTRYEVRVVARTSVGDGAASASAAVVPAGKPKAPTGVKATSPKTRYAKVSWVKPSANGSAITKYVVQYSTNGTTFKTLKTVSGSASSYTWTGAASKRKYYFRVYAVNGVGSSPVSAKAYVTVR